MRSFALLFVALGIAASGVVHVAANDCMAGSYWSGLACAPCSPGSYSDKNGATSCKLCPSGQYQSNFGQTSCQSAQAGWFASGPGAIAQAICPLGFYSSSTGSSACTVCPAGHYCNSVGLTAPNQCQPGRYAPTPGFAQDCLLCPLGTFNDLYGQTSCCLCCSGWYNDHLGQTQCSTCPGDIFVRQGWSLPGSVVRSACLPLSGAQSQCAQSSSGTCPGSTTASQAAQAKRRSLTSCKPGWKACQIPGGHSGLTECVDIKNDLWSCGGCPGTNDGGVDCSAIPNVDDVRCSAGRCAINKCRSGYKLSADGHSCVKSHVRRLLHQL